MGDSKKNGINRPTITSPDNLDIAIPSTLLCENETNKREMVILRMHVNKQVDSIIKNIHFVSENWSMRITDTKKDITPGNTNREIKYPF